MTRFAYEIHCTRCGHPQRGELLEVSVFFDPTELEATCPNCGPLQCFPDKREPKSQRMRERRIGKGYTHMLGRPGKPKVAATGDRERTIYFEVGPNAPDGPAGQLGSKKANQQHER